jgi:hypothetical protein
MGEKEREKNMERRREKKTANERYEGQINGGKSSETRRESGKKKEIKDDKNRNQR